MFIITIEGMEDEGAFAVKDAMGDKVVFLFEEEDDAMRYAIQLFHICIQIQDANSGSASQSTHRAPFRVSAQSSD